MAGRAGANEVIREGLANEFLEDHAIHKEMQLLEEVWKRISSNGAVAYGEQALLQAMAEGAIETLLVAVDLLRDEQTQLDGKLLSEWVRGLDDIGGTLMQCSTDHDAGEQLLGLGGVVALLRYKMV
jgi:protein pelota